MQRFAQAGLWVCVIVVAYLAFLPTEDPPGTSWDKGNHLLAFAAMAWLADLGWPGRANSRWRWGLLLGYGLLIETVQHVLPLRQFSLLDLIADGTGIMIYLGLRSIWYRLRKFRCGR